jgi:predicted ATPase
VLRLSPLTTPDADGPFAARAVAALPGFELTDRGKQRHCQQNLFQGGRAAVGDRVGAARLKAMSPEQILERLADRYTLLTRGGRGAPTRQQTLGLSVGWSHELCSLVE